jgi:23S rRNA pseudouridine1911/1915/1917 synthase
MKIEIISQDQDIVVVNKPAGLVVNLSKTTSSGTLQDWMTAYLKKHHLELNKSDWQSLVPLDFNQEYGTAQEIFNQRQGLVHRLDKNTSGVMVLAKNPGSLVNLLAQFKHRQVKKQYICLVHGKLRVPEGVITAPVGRSSTNRLNFAVQLTGRTAKTRYKLKQYFPSLNTQRLTANYCQQDQTSHLSLKNLKEFLKRMKIYQGFSLVNCWPKTGRTHQIRVHLKHWNHPLVGDAQYLGKKRAKLDSLWCKRQFLHASQLVFAHPRTNKQVTYQSPLATDLQQVLGLLNSSSLA